MSLPLKAIDRLFQRLEATYGAEWSRKWDGVPVQDVKTIWADELSGYAQNLSAVAWALENLPDRAPNVIEFRAICRRAPSPDVPRIEAPKADLQRVNAELAKLQEFRDSAAKETDGREWARRILTRHAAGEPINAIPLRFAREALNNWTD